ncbi:MAG: RsmE family RNA methyltransferase [Verrucomicrobiota bacterium]
MHRFYLAPEGWNSDLLILGRAETHHARTVLRLQPGASVLVFDGEGREVTGEVVSLEREKTRIRPVQESLTPPSSCHITLAQAVPKGRQMDLIIQKGVELGVSVMVPLITARTIVQADERKSEKWRQLAIEAAKQCGQKWLPRIQAPQSVAEYFRTNPAHDLRLVGSLGTDAISLKNVLTAQLRAGRKRPGNVLICIGPEGDFTPEELQLAQDHACIPVSFGPIVLRVETASIYCLSVLSYELSDRAGAGNVKAGQGG